MSKGKQRKSFIIWTVSIYWSRLIRTDFSNTHKYLANCSERQIFVVGSGMFCMCWALRYNVWSGLFWLRWDNNTLARQDVMLHFQWLLAARTIMLASQVARLCYYLPAYLGHKSTDGLVRILRFPFVALSFGIKQIKKS